MEKGEACWRGSEHRKAPDELETNTSPSSKTGSPQPPHPSTLASTLPSLHTWARMSKDASPLFFLVGVKWLRWVCPRAAKQHAGCTH